MARPAIAFFAGVVVTLAVVAIVRQPTPSDELRTPPSAGSRENETAAIPSQAATSGIVAPAQSVSAEFGVGSGAQGVPVAGQHLGSELTASEAGRGADSASAQQKLTGPRAQQQPESGLRSETTDPTQEQFFEPIPVAPEAEGLMTGDVAELHSRLEHELREASWSTYMEMQLAAYFGSKTQMLQQFNIQLIQCRSSMCELQAVGYGPDTYLNWVAATNDMYDQPWFEFSGVGGPVATKDGVTVILWIFHKYPSDSTPQSLDGSRRT
jgi:hypothetical protein